MPDLGKPIYSKHVTHFGAALTFRYPLEEEEENKIDLGPFAAQLVGIDLSPLFQGTYITGHNMQQVRSPFYFRKKVF